MSSHESCRKKVCVICIRKATREKGLSQTDIQAIRDYVIPGYDVSDPDYPCGICNGCYLRLNQKRNGLSSTLPIKQFTPNRSFHLRSLDEKNCPCEICTVAKSGLNASRGLKMKSGRPKTAVSSVVTTPKVLSLCSQCLTEIFPGCRHNCSKDRHKRAKIDNLERLAGSPTTAERVATRLGGGKGKASLPKKNLFSAEDIKVMRKNNNLTTRQTIGLTQDMRQLSGSSRTVESYIEKSLTEQNHVLDKYFTHENMLFLEEDKTKKTSRKFFEQTVIVSDLKGLIDNVLEKRGLERENALIRIGLDGGGGFMKICSSIFDVEAPYSSTLQSGQAVKKFKDSGVKKVIILGIAQGVQENYVNLKKLWINIGLDKLDYDFTIATDLKLANIMLGMQNHSSTHPCCWCDIDKNNLDKKGNLRTIASLYELFADYYDATLKSKTKVKSKDFGNVIHCPLIDLPDNEIPVYEKVPPPELHLMMGTVNHVLAQLENVWPGVQGWYQAINIKKSDYHGGCLEGNDCRKVLRKVESLKERCPDHLGVYVTVLKLFDTVVKDCFGSDLSKNYRKSIKNFSIAYRQLGISITPKVHAVLFHVEDFCEFTGKGLGPWSEQTSESLHQEFSKCWKKFFVKSTDNPVYPERFLAAVQHFNSLNI